MPKVPTVNQTTNVLTDTAGPAGAVSLGASIGGGLLGQVGRIAGATGAAAAMGDNVSKTLAAVEMKSTFDALLAGQTGLFGGGAGTSSGVQVM